MFVEKISIERALELEALGKILIVSSRRETVLVSQEKLEWRENFASLRSRAPHVDINKLFSYYNAPFLIETPGAEVGGSNIIQWNYFRGILNLEKDQVLSDSIEYLYILINKDYPNLVKIGMTLKTPEKRLASINSTGVVTHWQLAFSLPIIPGSSYKLEQQVHKYFADRRYHAENTDDKEMFFLDLPEAIGEIRRISQYFTAGSPIFYSK